MERAGVTERRCARKGHELPSGRVRRQGERAGGGELKTRTERQQVAGQANFLLTGGGGGSTIEVVLSAERTGYSL
jgi:hypothetical protein